jgi:molybdate transport system substrate-binding protein
MRVRWICCVLLTLAVLAVAACSPTAETEAGQTELIVSAAASLSPPLEEIRTIYEKRFPNTTLLLNYGASGALQRQIEQGAPADLFLSAQRKWTDKLMDKGLLDEQQATLALTNSLVVIAAADRTESIATLADLSTDSWRVVAVGEPETVPAGMYAKEAFTHYRLWGSIAPKAVLGKDVRQVLAYVETGNADAAVVYRTDAASSAKVRILLEVPAVSHSSIQYPFAVLKNSKYPEQAKQFYSFLLSEPAAEVFRKYGFWTPPL